MNKIIFKPIGLIKSDFKKPKDAVCCCEKGLKDKTTAKIYIYKKYQNGLKEIENYSHLWVIYYLNKIKRYEIITSPAPSSIKNIKKVGIFASRSQYRPNPIALKLVKLIKAQNNKLIVEGLDGICNSPVLDIKPYVSGFDRPKKFKDAVWYKWFK